MTDVQSFNNWVNRFERTRLGAYALQALEKAFPADEESMQARLFSPLRNVVLSSCYAAAIFDPETDPGQTYRTRTKAVLTQLEPQREAVAKLRKFIAQYPSVADIAAHRAVLDLKHKGIGIGATDGAMRRISQLLDRLLEAYAACLTSPLPLCGSGAALGRFTYGCLVYEAPLDKSKCNNRPRETMLLFDLVQTFRLRSSGISLRSHGERMPVSGNSHYGLVANLVNATLDEKRFYSDSAEDLLKSFLKQNPGVGFVSWPARMCSTPACGEVHVT